MTTPVRASGSNLGSLVDGLRAVDEMIAKVMDLSEVAQMARIETLMRQYLHAEWERHAREAGKAAEAELRKGKGAVTDAEAGRVARAVDRVMAGWEEAVGARFADDTAAIYRLARAAGLKKALGITGESLAYSTEPFTAEIRKAIPKGTKLTQILPSFDVTDIQAQDALKTHQLFWIGTHYKDNVSESIAKVTKETIIDAGRNRTVAGAAISKVVTEKLKHVEIPSGWKGTAKQYFEGLAANAATVARAHGQIRSFQEAGVTKYTIVNPMDDRTCPVCSHFDGMTWTVSEAAKQMAKELAAKTPDDVKKAHPWLKLGEIKKLAPTPGKATVGLMARGQRLPPFHYRCRCAVDVASDTEFTPYTDAELEASGVTLKPPPPPPEPPPPPPPLKAPKPAPPAKKAIHKPAPAPKTPKPASAPLKQQKTAAQLAGAPKVAAKVADPLSVPTGARPGFRWREDEMKLLPTRLDGMHTKFVYEAPDGTRWLFKPVREEFRAYGDKVAEEIARALGVPHPELHVVRMKGQLGSIQRMYDDVAGPLGSTPINTLTRRQIEQIQREHAYDFLIGNHDGHGGNLLIRKSGDVVGIDKGQLFKFAGKDSISVDYNPNSGYGVTSYYNKSFKSYASGAYGRDFALDPNAKLLRDFLDRLDKLPDDQYLAILKPYSSRRPPVPGLTEQQFLQIALDRKKQLRKILADFYADMEKKRRTALGLPLQGARRATPKKPKQPAPVTKLDDKFAREVREAGWAGKVIYVAGDQYEGMQWLSYGVEGNGTILETKLTAVGDRVFLARIGAVADTRAAAFADPYYDDVLKVFKSFNYHLTGPKADGIIPQHTVDLHKSLMDKLSKAGRDPSAPKVQQDMARYYFAQLSKITDATPGKAWSLNPAKAGTMMSRYQPPQEAVPAPQLPEGVKITRQSAFKDFKKRLDNGRIRKLGDVGEQFNGEVYEIDFGGGVRGQYIRHGDSNLYSKQGRFRLLLDTPPEKLKGRVLEDALGNMERIGLSSRLATEADLELLTLIKVSRAAGLGGEFAADAALSVEENIAKIKGAWEKRLGKKLVPGENYTPLPVPEGVNGTGWARHVRFDIDVKELLDNDVGLYHRLYGGVENDLKAILGGNTKSLLATEERYRTGVVAQGMSPGRDQETGGASYVFTRLRTSYNAGGASIRLHPSLMTDPDAISYPGDVYGRVQPDFIEANRQREVSQWLKTARGDYIDNEVIFKHQISLERWLDEVMTRGKDERERVIKLFKDAGITHVGPDRKAIEDAVVVGEWTPLNK